MKKMKKMISVILAILCAAMLFALPAFAECTHQYTAVTVAPTCAERGYTLYTCPLCGDFYYDDYKAATGHSYGDWYVVTEASCSAEGMEQRDCMTCHSAETKTVSVLPHSDLNYDGKCDVCGAAVEVEDIFSPFDWLKAFFKAVIEWFRAIFA